ncbi:MAG: DUF1232 domain-containing protein [Proteobacteria bacterium]|nr:DUF1232 domain-containing protein [Pseudomonadota bacterium]
MRCALIGALGYLVQPHDLLPDKMPGGFGFVDDCMMLRAATSEFLNVLPSNFTTRERERQFLDILAICIPMDQTSEFQGAIEGIRLAFHIYLWQPVDEVEARIEQLIHDPLGTKLSEPESTTVPLPTIPVLTIDPKKDRIRKDGSQYMIVFGKGGRVTIP